MKINITPINIFDKNKLEQLLAQYQLELSIYDDKESVKAEGYKYLDSYFSEKDRFPFFIRVNDEIAGFVLVNEYFKVLTSGHAIAEFFVLKKFRRRAVGDKAARLVFDKFRGAWEISELTANVPAQAFWRKVISDYTNGNFKETIMDNEEWHGSVQTFISKKS